ncbi:hypothetical protein PHMEG_0003054 [Phytophthora megakarya]|uniref:Uncharacterized protein n=1 Tax=Phytophthora megakarya TaxID=4795 RepID=A0A225WX30_9STRA|nr:hypothetical protein PHMEG_0003054 [Phytophthora megakarya]
MKCESGTICIQLLLLPLTTRMLLSYACSGTFFGRASDLTLLCSANLSIGAGNIFFVRFIRIKSSEEQSVSLFPDDAIVTCLLLAIALALITHQLPEQHSTSHATFTPSTPLLDLIDHPETVAQQEASGKPAKGVDTLPGIHNYVNRVLDRVVAEAGVGEYLTSHSFRREGAQHANGAGMCIQ